MDIVLLDVGQNEGLLRMDKQQIGLVYVVLLIVDIGFYEDLLVHELY